MPLEPSIFGLSIFGEDIFTNQSTSRYGIYYTKVFKKPLRDIWHQVEWSSNINNFDFDVTRIVVRIRTGSDLPFNYYTGNRYTLNEINSIIKNDNITVFDSLIDRFTLNRSSMEEIPNNAAPKNVYQYPTSYTSDISSRVPPVPLSKNFSAPSDFDDADILSLGTAYNTMRLQTDEVVTDESFFELITNESHIISNITPFTITLLYPPKTTSVKISGFTEVFSSPSANQFLVSYEDGVITFNTTDKGKTVKVSYYAYTRTKNKDCFWTYWSLPIVNTPSFIQSGKKPVLDKIGNIIDKTDFDYIQARIDLGTVDVGKKPEMFNINLSSIQRK